MGIYIFLDIARTQFNADGMISGCLDSELIEMKSLIKKK